MNVMIIDGDVTYPPTSGKRLRTLNLMLPLARRHRLTYVGRGQGNPEENRRAVECLSAQGIETHVVDDPIPRKKGLSFYARLAGNLLSPLPYSVASHRSERMRAVVRELAARQTIDLLQVEWSGYLYVVEGIRAPIVLQAHNVDTLIWQRFQDTERHRLKRWYIAGQRRKFEKFERRAFHAVRRVVAVSPEDAALAREKFGVDRIDVVDNGVDVDFFRDVRPTADSRTILYLGSLDWRPNLDALRLLLDPIFPNVQAHEPDARLVIVGRHPPDWLRQRVAGMPGVELHADVPDVRPYLARSMAMSVPLRIGGGSRLKILESLAAGLPVVSTHVGAEGLALRPGQDYTLADSPEQQAAALIGCLRQPDRALAQAEQGRQTVRDRYDWPMLAERLERVWEKAARTKTPSPPGPILV
jgi:glycosyltransferase involved in cell wall biosynthesis